MFKTLEDKEIRYLLENNFIGHLGYIYNNKPFVVPITFYYDEESKAIICYSADGHKMNAMRIHPSISIQINTINTITTWKSILVHGNFEQKYGSEAKAYLHKFSLGIKDLIIEKEHEKVNFIEEFSSKSHDNNIPAVFLLKIQEITGKKRSD